MTPHPVTYGDVYHLDFGRRTEDFPTWSGLNATAPPGPVIEVGCGDGRLAHCFSGRDVHGIDLDAQLLARARDRGVKTIWGAGEEERTWQTLPYGTAGLAIVAYSTLYLFNLRDQHRVLSKMASRLAAGGLLAVEAFLPDYSRGTSYITETLVGNPNGIGDPWVRRSTFARDVLPGDSQSYRDSPDCPSITRVSRLYGPDRKSATMELAEIIYYTPAHLLVGIACEMGRGSERGPVSALERYSKTDIPGSVLMVFRRL